MLRRILPQHYTTAYDLYLIFQAAMKYDDFMEILQTPEYEASYQAADGTAGEGESGQ